MHDSQFMTIAEIRAKYAGNISSFRDKMSETRGALETIRSSAETVMSVAEKKVVGRG